MPVNSLCCRSFIPDVLIQPMQGWLRGGICRDQKFTERFTEHSKLIAWSR
jgi:hypothetical protein